MVSHPYHPPLKNPILHIELAYIIQSYIDIVATTAAQGWPAQTGLTGYFSPPRVTECGLLKIQVTLFCGFNVLSENIIKYNQKPDFTT